MTAVCTLFEGDYHIGLVALVNSLVKAGFRGRIFAGFRGSLPSWAKVAQADVPKWCKAWRMMPADQVELVFLPLDTSFHLTNYKPDFMLRLFQVFGCELDSLFYFDPDITVLCPWAYFEGWSHCGVALCEDVNSPLPENHPRRVAWRTFFNPRGFQLRMKTEMYVNGGFQGIRRSDMRFLELWRNLQSVMSEDIGGLHRSALHGEKLPKDKAGPWYCFDKTDQDALNAAIEAFDGSISLMGQEAMAFKPGGWTMAHALGGPKPWQRRFVWDMLRGRRPSQADEAFWENASSPIQAFSPSHVQQRLGLIKMCRFICRFYSQQ